MALVDLKSNLTTLKFGNDQPGYGSSGLPYIKTYIPPVPNSLNAKGPGFPIFNPGTTGNLDYPIRGGDVNFQIGQQSYTLSSQIDRTRIARFLKDAPRGDAFLKKQVGLQLTNPKMETGNVLFGLSERAPLPGILENTRVYKENGSNTLIQIQNSGNGAHALRHGTVPFTNYQRHYYLTVNDQNINNEKSTNRLLNLNSLKMISSVSPFVNLENVPDVNLVNNLGISLNRNILFQYLGGPGSTYGIGSTSIKRVVDTTKLGVSEKRYAGRNAMVYDKIKEQAINNISDGIATTNIQDFRDQLPLVGSYIPWGDKTIDKRFFVAAGNYKDKLNRSSAFVFNNSAAPWEFEDEPVDDLIKLVFECISNDDPNYSLALFFRAFLTAGITDNNSAQLNSFKYAGRGENFYTYQGFDRSIAFSFRIAAGSKEEMKPMYNRLNSLISQVYPDYGPDSGFMRAPLVRITVGDYLYRMPGFLESINVTVDNSYPWEVNLDEDSAQLPQVLDVSISFRPISDYLPKRSSIGTIKDTDISTNLDESTTVAIVSGDIKNTPIIANKDFIDVQSDSIIKGNRAATSQEIRGRKLELASEQNRKNDLNSSVQNTINKNNLDITDRFLQVGGEIRSQSDFGSAINSQKSKSVFIPPKVGAPPNITGKLPGG